MNIHYNCTRQFLVVYSFLLISHPYPPSFSWNDFYNCPTNFLLVAAKLERQGAVIRAYITHACAKTRMHLYYAACALAQTAPLGPA